MKVMVFIIVPIARFETSILRAWDDESDGLHHSSLPIVRIETSILITTVMTTTTTTMTTMMTMILMLLPLLVMMHRRCHEPGRIHGHLHIPLLLSAAPRGRCDVPSAGQTQRRQRRGRPRRGLLQPARERLQQR